MLELLFLFVGFGLGATAFMPSRYRLPWFFGIPLCPVCRKARCYGVDADCKAFPAGVIKESSDQKALADHMKAVPDCKDCDGQAIEGDSK